MPSAATLALTAAVAATIAGAWAVAAVAEDRYGPSQPVSAQPVASRPAGGFLSWPSKTPPPQAVAIQAAPPQLAQRAASAEPMYRPARAEAIQASPLPASIYAPYPSTQPAAQQPRAEPYSRAAAAPTADTAHSSQAPRYYSVHREVGLTPDPIPLPQQFVADGATADMAAPPPPLAPHPVPGSQAVNANTAANTPANRTRALQAADDADPLAN